jgi:membrane-bound lytic murein transglycosylase B
MRTSAAMAAFLAGLWATSVAATEPLAYRDGLRSFKEEMIRAGRFRDSDLIPLLSRASYRPEIVEAMRRPYEAKPWGAYRALFLTPDRVHQGVAFWRRNKALLERARASYGVPPEIIVAILGVETKYGQITGAYPVIDALSTLAFAYPPRADFFRAELEQLLHLALEDGLKIARVTGSYAGAMGEPQFLPSSYRVYAVDFDGDGRRDLWGSDADVIGSVANYLFGHGWQPDRPIAVRAQLAGSSAADLPIAERQPMKPLLKPDALEAAGVSASDGRRPDAPVSLVRLAVAPDEYWLAFDNCYVITRYNHSNLYAMVVFQLSKEIKRLYDEPGRQAVAGN